MTLKTSQILIPLILQNRNPKCIATDEMLNIFINSFNDKLIFSIHYLKTTAEVQIIDVSDLINLVFGMLPIYH